MGLHTILLDPSRPKRMFIAISAAGVFRSDDDGGTWRPVNRGLRSEFLPDPTAEVGHCVHRIAMHPSRPDALYMQKHWDVMRSADAGESWHEVNGNLPTDFGFPIEAIPALRRGRARRGLSLEGFEVVAAVPAALTVDRAAGVAAFKAELMRYLALPFYRAMLAKGGFAAELAAWDRAPRPESVADRLAASLGAVGDFATLQAFVVAHRQAGVTLPAIRPIGFPDAPHYLPTLEAASAV